MVSPVGIIRNPGMTVDRMVEVQPAGQTMVAGLKQFGQELSVQSEGIFNRERENAYNEYSVQLSENLDRIEQENISDPAKFAGSAKNYYKGFSANVRDPNIRGALDKQFASWNMTANRRVKGNFENNLNQQAQYGSLKVLDRLETEMASIGPDFFSQDPVASTGAAVRFKDLMERYQGAVTQQKTDGSFLFSPEFAVNKQAQMIDRTVGQALTNYVKVDKDPVGTLEAIKNGKMPDMSGVFGVANPLEMLSPEGRDRAMALAEQAISQREEMVLSQWGVSKAAIKVKLAEDPLTVDTVKEMDAFTAAIGSTLTPATENKIKQEMLGIEEDRVKATKDYRLAAPYLSGMTTFDGSDQSKKAIETGYEFMQKQGKSLGDRAKWIVGTGINTIPGAFANEIEAGLQAAIKKQDGKAVAELAEVYDMMTVNSPITAADLDGKLSDKTQSVLMQFRDMARLGGVGPEMFKDAQRIMEVGKEDMAALKKDVAEFEKGNDFKKLAAGAIDKSILPFTAPDTQDAITRQAANDFRKIFTNKYIATRDEKYAKEAATKLTAGLYHPTSFAREGFMRMAPEAHYAVPNDTDTTWMKDDLALAYETLPGVKPEDFDNVQLVADPRADPGTKAPEYLITLSDRTSDRFDSLGYTWKPDREARVHFNTMKAAGKLDGEYFKKEQGLNVGYDYKKFLRDWNAGKFNRGISNLNPNDVFELGVIQQESGGRQFGSDGQPIKSNKGALGIAQVMPETAPEAAKLAGLDFDENKYRNDQSYNKAIGQAYFNKQVDSFGDMTLALMAYNAGPGAVDKYLEKHGDPRKNEITMNDFIDKFPYAETRTYVKKISKRLADAR